jgi:hypothetical protein
MLKNGFSVLEGAKVGFGIELEFHLSFFSHTGFFSSIMPIFNLLKPLNHEKNCRIHVRW